MNKFFKTIWNNTLRTFVAVGENGKSKSKGSTASKFLKTSALAGILAFSGAANALVTYDINGWITGTEGVYLNPISASANEIFNVGLINVGLDGGQGGYGENAIFWDETSAAFSGTLNTKSLINYTIAALPSADDPYYNDDYEGFASALIDLESLDGATVNFNGSIIQQLASTDYNESNYYNVYSSGTVLDSSITNNASIVDTVSLSIDAQDDVESAETFDAYVGSEVFNLNTLENSTFTNNAAVSSTLQSRVEANVEQDIFNDRTIYNGDDLNYTAYNDEGGGASTFTNHDWISYDDFANHTYETDQRHVFLSVEGTNENSVDGSVITNNASVVLTSNSNLDVTLDLDNGSVATYDVSLVDVDAVSITDVYSNNFRSDSDTYAFEFESLSDSTVVNNGIVNVSDVVNYNVVINYGGVDDSDTSWASSVSYNPVYAGEYGIGFVDYYSYSTFNSDNDATLYNNTFTAESKASGVMVNNLDESTSSFNSTITNNESMIVNSTLNFSLGLEQREVGDISATFSTGNIIDARSVASGVEMVFEDYSADVTGAPTDLSINNNALLSVTANNNFSLSGQDTMDVGEDIGSAIDFITAEATGIYMNNVALGEADELLDVYPDSINRVGNNGLFNVLVTNTGTLLATANLSASTDGSTYDSDSVYARAVGVDMRIDNYAYSLTDVEDVTSYADTETSVGLNNSGSIIATASASGIGRAFATGFLSNEDYYANDGDIYNVGIAYENNSDLYIFQNSGSILATATANVDDATAVGAYVYESNLKWLNSGSITALATSTQADALAYGQYFDSDLFNTSTNSGSITVTAVSGSGSGDEAHAWGIYLDDEIDGSGSVYGQFINTGSISVVANNDQGSIAQARVLRQDQQEGNLTNSGVARAYAQGAFSVNAVGFEIDNVDAYDPSEPDVAGNPGMVNNSGLLAAYAETSFDADNLGDGVAFTITSRGMEFDDIDGIVENTGVILASSEYNHYSGSPSPINAGSFEIGDTYQILTTGSTIFPGAANNNVGTIFTATGTGTGTGTAVDLSNADFANAFQSTIGLQVGNLQADSLNSIIRNNDKDGLNAGTIRAIATTDATFDQASGTSAQIVNGLFVDITEGIVVSEVPYQSLIENEVGGYIGALLDGTNDFPISDYDDGGYALNNSSSPSNNIEELSNVAGIYINEHRGEFNNGENRFGGSREYYTAIVEGYLNFNTTQLADIFGALGSGTFNGYSVADLATLGLDTTDLVYNPESSYQMIAGSQTGRDNYAFVEPTLNGGSTTGLRYNLAYNNLLADNGLYGDGGYSLIINHDNLPVIDTDELRGEINNYCYGVFEGQVYVGQTALDFYNAGRINTRIDDSYIGSSFTNTDSGILQIAIVDDGIVVDGSSGITSGQFNFWGDVDFSDTTNIRVSVRDDVGGLTTAELDGTTISDVLVDQSGGNEVTWRATSFQVQDNRLDVNFNAVIDGEGSATDIVGYDTGLTTLEAAAARPTKNLGWLLDDYNLLHDADYQTRELNAYLYALGTSENSYEVNAQLHKALPLLAGGNTLSNMQLLNDTRNNIEDRLVSRLDQRVGDVYMGKKNAWFRAFGNDQSQSTRDSTAGYDSKALGGTFGIDNMVGDTLIGAAFTYARNDVDGSSHFNGQEGKTRTWDVALYGSTPVSADKLTYVNYQVGGGIMDTSTRREFFDLNCCNEVVASGTYDTKFARASINLNHRMDLTQKTSFTPSVGLTYTYMDEDAYTEQGAGDLKLHVKSNQTDQALATIAGRFDFYPTDGVRLYASALAGYDMINEQVDLKANFVNLVDSAFTTKGIDQSDWMGNAKAGVSVNVGDVELNAGYGYTYRSDFDNHTASLRALYSF